MSEAAVKIPAAPPKPDETATAALPGTACPLPITQHEQIVLGHGSGGKLSAQLIERIFLPAFSNPVLDKLDDLKANFPESIAFDVGFDTTPYTRESI